MSKSKKSGDLCLERYLYQGKEYFKVTVQKRNKEGKMIKKTSRFTKTGSRITSQRAAEEVKFQLKKELEFCIGAKSIYTWSSWRDVAVDGMRKDGYKESTLSHYLGRLDKWIDPSWNDRELSSFSKDDIYEFIHEYLVIREASDTTRRTILKKIHCLFEVALNAGEVNRNPAKGIKVEVPMEEGLALTPGEVEILLTKGKAIDHEYYPHWVMALLTGMRCGELYALRWSDIDFEAGIIRVLRQYTSKDGVHPPKRGKTRPIDLSPELRTFLMDLKRKHGQVSQKLWSWRVDKRLVDEVHHGKKTGKQKIEVYQAKESIFFDDLVLPRISSWQRGMQASELKAFCRRIGIREVKFHDLRATHITNLLDNGAAISKVMKQVGHSRMSTTDAYHRLSGVQVKGVTSHLGFTVPEDELPCNVVQLFGKKAQ